MTEFIVDTRLSRKYSGLKRRASDIEEITIHGTGGGQNSEAIIAWMSGYNCERKDMYAKAIGLFPFLIDMDGKVYNIMPAGDWYYHSDAGQADMHTIGIELQNPQINNGGGYTEDQYEALKWIIRKLMDSYPISRITSHDFNRGHWSKLLPKPCPGYQFNWAKVEEVVTEYSPRTVTIFRG